METIYFEKLFPSGDYFLKCGNVKMRYVDYTLEEAKKRFKKELGITRARYIKGTSIEFMS